MERETTRERPSAIGTAAIGRRGRKDHTAEALGRLTAKLPRTWHVRTARPSASSRPITGSEHLVAIVRVSAHRGHRSLLICGRPRSAKHADVMAAVLALRARAAAEGSSAYPVVLAPYLSTRARDALRKEGLGYSDSTGNVAVTIPDPYLRIEARGATRAPGPRGARLTMGGAKVKTVLRLLLDSPPPHGIVALARRAMCDPGYASRIVSTLASEGLVKRVPQGPVTSIDREGLLRRIAVESRPGAADVPAEILAVPPAHRVGIIRTAWSLLPRVAARHAGRPAERPWRPWGDIFRVVERAATREEALAALEGLDLRAGQRRVFGEALREAVVTERFGTGTCVVTAGSAAGV